jgi:putative transposase
LLLFCIHGKIKKNVSKVKLMPRRAREKCESGIYHIMQRGANRQEIFHDEDDSLRFLETLEKYKKKVNLKVYGWCLMGNHIHLLLQEGTEELGVTMKRIGVSFAWYYNWKYKTTGHLFQDRYRSEKVSNDEYLTTVIRYIHQNPVKASMVKAAAEWKWSSCAGYYGEKLYPVSLLDDDLILDMFAKDKDEAQKRFKVFNEAENDDQCLEDNITRRLTDEEAKEEIKRLIADNDISKIKSMDKKQRNEVLQSIKRIDGLTQRQTARILGISCNLVFKA